MTVPLVFLLATLVMTYPVCVRLTTHMAGTGGDGWVYLWNHWWMAYAFRTPGQSLFHTGHLFYPGGAGLYTTTLTLANCFLSLPIQAVGGPLVATNIYYLFSFWLAGYGAYRLIRYLVSDPAAAVVGGLVFAFCPYMTAHALGHFNLIATGWMPLFLLYFIRSMREAGWRNPLVAALFLVVQLYSEFILGIFAILMAVAWFVMEAAQSPEYRKPAIWGRLLVAFGIAGITLVPYFLAAARDTGVRELVSRPSWFGANEHSAALLGFFLPSPLHPFWGERVRPITDQFYGTSADNTVYLGWSVLIPAVYGLWACRRQVTARTVAIVAVIFTLLALGPTLHLIRAPLFNKIPIDGVNITPGLPYTLFHFVPVLRQLRIPTRFVIVTMLMLGTLLAFGLAYLRGQRLAGRPLWVGQVCVGVAGLLVLADFSAHPTRTVLADVPQVYHQLGSLPKGAAVLDLPFGCLDGLQHYGRIMEKSMYFQTVHERPILSGYISRMPEAPLHEFRSLPLINELATRLDPAAVAAPCVHSGADTGDGELDRLKIGAVILHKNELTPEVIEFAHRHLTAGRWQQEGALEVYYPDWVQEGK